MSTKDLEIVAAPDSPSIVIRRTFDAPRDLVFECWSKPEHLKRWLGPRRLTWKLLEMDFRVGGTYRWVQRDDASGKEFSFHGEFREIVRPSRIVQTFVYEGTPDDEAVDTIVLEEKDGKTVMTTTSLHRSVKARDQMLASGMEKGIREGYERLDDVLAELRAAGR